MNVQDFMNLGEVGQTPSFEGDIIKPVSGDTVPVGTIIFLPRTTVPVGYLAAEGGTFDPLIYPDLYAYLGSSTLPDMKDRVMRGAGALAGTAGTTQADAIQNITGTFKVAGSTGGIDTATGAFATTGNPQNYPSTMAAVNAAVGVANFDASRVVRTATETRVNAFIGRFFIKAFSTPVNSGTLDVAALAAQVSDFPATYLTAASASTAYMSKSGGTFTGQVNWGSTHIDAATGDIYSIRAASPTTGVVFLGNAGRYLFFDGTQYVMPTSALKVGSTVYAGAAFLETNGNVQGSIWTNLGYNDCYTAVVNRIESRALAFANDRVANMSYRYVSAGSAGIGTNWDCPAGSMMHGLVSNGSGNISQGKYKYIQVYDPVRGWVGFGEA
jgi:hypothetical protein